ncbi:MAG TPA: hypothetical protein VNM37_21235, partial [Candidatus Dormibacteraeota bacterium]|nr:hypothetical protein [Candidatus Dormibacteraeota bacterium]
GGAWPAKWNGSQFCSEPTINIVHHDFLKPVGTSYLATREKEEEFIGSRDLWFRPIHTRVGPDGALYIIDFYNQAVVHNDTRGTPHGANNAAVRPDRDHYFGRIWRVQYKEAKELAVPNLAQAARAELVKALEHPNMWVRMTAQRLLGERAEITEAELLSENEPLRQLAQNKQAPPYARLHALWTRRQVAASWAAGKLPDPTGTFLAADLERAFHDSSAAVRKAAFQIVSEDGLQVKEARKFKDGALAGLKDSDSRVRLKAILALGAISQPLIAGEPKQRLSSADAEQISQALVGIYPDLHDPWMESAVVGVAAQAPEDFIKAALVSSDPAALQSLVRQLSSQIALKAEPARASELVIALSSAPASTDALKQIVLENLARARNTANPDWTP